MRLLAYPTVPTPPVLRPASPRRTWMDETTNRFAYRCLPLTIGNQYGWEMLCPCTFEALWTGGSAPGAVTIVRLDGGEGRLPDSHFGEGIITFHPGYLFRTEVPYNLMVGGPVNSRKDGIVPLSGVVETDWLPFPFTMNWALTRVGVPIRFEEGEPFCQIYPIHRDLVEQVQPEIRSMETEPALEQEYRAWTDSRDRFNEGLATEGSEARKEGWQRFYNRGTLTSGAAVETRHRTRLAVPAFVGAAEPEPAAVETA